MGRSRYRVVFYRTKAGKCQACDYARSMAVGHQAKAKRWFVALAEMGQELPEDYGKHLRDGVWELRIIIQHHPHRFLFSYRNDVIVVTNAFLKKSREVPECEIEKSRRAMDDWARRRGWEDL